MQKGARAIILRNGKMLLGKRLKADSFYGQWCTFGGLSKTGEAAEATLRRELHEELGISVLNPRFIAVVECKLPEKREKLQQHFYVVKHWKGKITNKAEHMEIKWFALDELKRLSLGRVLRRVIENNFKDFLSHNPLSNQ
jgi:8-oxo-dGTP diphosphatase